MLNFPSAPQVGDIYPVSGSPQYRWDGQAWMSTMDDKYVKASGDQMTGALTLNADPAVPLGAATKQYADSKTVDMSGYLRKSGDTMTGLFTTAGSGGAISQPGMSNSIQVISTPGSGHAFMTFHVQGYFGCHFGLASDGNFYMGGWSHGNAAYKFWTSRDFPGVPISNARLPIAGDYAHQYGNAIEPYLGALMSGMSGVQGFSVITCRYRWLQVLTSSWWTVAAV